MPISRAQLKEVFGKGLIATGPRSQKRGAPYTYVTRQAFLMAFDLQSLRDLPELEHLKPAGCSFAH